MALETPILTVANGCVIKIHGIAYLYHISPIFYGIRRYVRLKDPDMQYGWIDKQIVNFVRFQHEGEEVIVTDLFFFRMEKGTPEFNTTYEVLKNGYFNNFVKFAMCTAYPTKVMSRIVSTIWNISDFEVVGVTDESQHKE